MDTMKQNLGSADRVIRLILAAIVFILYFSQILTGTLGLVLLIVGVILALTSVMSFCPLYALLGIRSNSSRQPS